MLLLYLVLVCIHAEIVCSRDFYCVLTILGQVPWPAQPLFPLFPLVRPHPSSPVLYRRHVSHNSNPKPPPLPSTSCRRQATVEGRAAGRRRLVNEEAKALPRPSVLSTRSFINTCASATTLDVADKHRRRTPLTADDPDVRISSICPKSP